ncbi:hypothetical protein AMJ85_10550 [candidate division BRC1 bacterium SM23_51]|nr:MAG: hypothetical protein AMJ85_10550 [candidate division BRC1 bacterium SM23_51]
MDTDDGLFQHRVDGIVAELANYFEIRYAQLTRIKSALASMYEDLLWQQMKKVRDVMAHEKMFGPIRLRAGDILASRDEAKRRAVMGRIDQASILNELVPEQEESAERRPGMVAVRNMRALYTAVDPSLGPVIELSDIWLWWDILDAADVYNFQEQKKLIDRRRGEEITKSIQDFYHQAMHIRDERLLERQEILGYEFAYLESIWRSFMERRAEDESFMLVIKRDPVGGDDTVNDLILALSRHISARQRLSQEGGLDDRLRGYYAKLLKFDDAAKLTAERAIAHEDLTIIRLREDLRMGLERGTVLGEAYDYKAAQGDKMKRDLDHYRELLSAPEPTVAKTVPRAEPTPAAVAVTPASSEQEPAKTAAAEQETLADEGPIFF